MALRFHQSEQSISFCLWTNESAPLFSPAEEGENFLTTGGTIFSSAGQVGFNILSEKSIDWIYLFNYFCDLWEKKSHSPMISFHIYKILEIF